MLDFLSKLKTILPCYKNKSKKKQINFNEAVDIDDAIEVTGFGKFNIILLFFCILICFSAIFNTTTMSYVIPSAECDLSLSLMHKGFLNAASHTGMIASAFVAGYLADTLGRRRIILYGALLDGLCGFISSFSINFWMLAVCKFLAGMSMCGPSLCIAAYVSEFNAKPIRSTIVMYIGLCYAFASLNLPLIAWFFLENPVNIEIGRYYELHGWQTFLIATSVPSFLLSIYTYFLPESPKFLASRGRNQESLEVLKMVFSTNSGKSGDEYPVKELTFSQKDPNSDKLNEDKDKTESISDALRGGLRQIKPLFVPPYVIKLILILIIEYGTLMGCNTLRLWLPQLFKMMSDSSPETSSLCEMLSIGNKTVVDVPLPIDGVCDPVTIEQEVFENALIVASFQFSFAVAGGLLVSLLGKKRLLFITLFLGGLCTIAMYWCETVAQARTLAAMSLSLCAVGSNAVISVIVDIFPTELNGMAISSTLMTGRMGSISGNVMFPILLSMGCLPPFVTLGSILIGCAIFSLALPRSQKPKEENIEE